MGAGGSDVREARVGFSNCSSCEWEVVAADVGEDFAYLLAIERTTASVRGSEPTSYILRSTTIFRRENGAWKIVHRHAGPVDDSAGSLAPLHDDR
jgi:ketosteroid isomerase-like protein